MIYIAGFMTRGFALIAENGATDVWVMEPAVTSVERTVNMPDSALARVRSVSGVCYATPLALGVADVRLPNGRFEPFQVIGVDDSTLIGAPNLADGTSPTLLHAPDAVLVDAGGTSGKLGTPARSVDQWPSDGAHLAAPLRELRAGDELLINDNRARVGRAGERLRGSQRGSAADRLGLAGEEGGPAVGACQATPAGSGLDPSRRAARVGPGLRNG